MGGHGALSIAFGDDGGSWCSVSALAPICHPSDCPWGRKAFKTYLSSAEEEAKHDACILLSKRKAGTSIDKRYDDVLVDVGGSDEFLLEQLKIDDLSDAAKECGQSLTVNVREGYDHSYSFVSSFIENHVRFHSRRLKKASGRLYADAKHNFRTAGLPIRCDAMVARAPNVPMTLETIVVDPPREGEVRVRVMANALCHTDVYTLDGQDPEGLFPCILGHEAGCVVESIGAGVTSVDVGDHVVPCYTPQCAEPGCVFCMSPKTNLCPKIRSTQGRGVMPDGTVRFRSSSGEDIYHFMGCSTMSEYTVLAEISCAKIPREARLDTACLFGCGVSTGLGAVWNTCKVEPNSTVAVFGLGAVVSCFFFHILFPSRSPPLLFSTPPPSSPFPRTSHSPDILLRIGSLDLPPP